MLKPNPKRGRRVAAITRPIAIVASQFNARYVDSMLEAALKELRGASVREVEVHRVPGAFELPVVAARLARGRNPRWGAILCLGVIFRGETTHAEHIGLAVSHALAQLQTVHPVPVIHGVYLFENVRQATVRCLGRRHNRGVELARTALAMAALMDHLNAREGGVNRVVPRKRPLP